MKVKIVIAVALTLISTRALTASAQGPALYGENCQKCHGVIGTPPKTMKAKFPKIVTFDPGFISTRSADSVVKILQKGVGAGDEMKSFKSKLTVAEMEEVAQYVMMLGKKVR